MWVAKTIEEARRHRQQVSGRVALVPTMGALHKGHAKLIEAAKITGCEVVVSIFVNPTQFAPGEDYDRYPRRLDEDLALCRQGGVVGVFCPTMQQMYPPGQPGCELEVGLLSNQLEGEHRPGHFAGVCRVVAKLLNIIEPDIACFGQKDYQQLKVVQAMVEDLAMSVRIMGCQTVREEDGLACSSRNVRLGLQARRHAVGLYRALMEAKMLVEQDGESDPGVVEAAMVQAMCVYQIETDYAVIRHPHSLAPLDCIEPRLTGGVVALVAGVIDGVRLIDNMLLGQSAVEA